MENHDYLFKSKNMVMLNYLEKGPEVDHPSPDRTWQEKEKNNNTQVRIHWELYIKYGLVYARKWYKKLPPSLTANKQVKLMWYTTILTLKHLESNRPDITLVHNKRYELLLIDVTEPLDKNTRKSEQASRERYQDLAGYIRGINQAAAAQVASFVVGDCKISETSIDKVFFIFIIDIIIGEWR